MPTEHGRNGSNGGYKDKNGHNGHRDRGEGGQAAAVVIELGGANGDAAFSQAMLSTMAEVGTADIQPVVEPGYLSGQALEMIRNSPHWHQLHEVLPAMSGVVSEVTQLAVGPMTELFADTLTGKVYRPVRVDGNGVVTACECVSNGYYAHLRDDGRRILIETSIVDDAGERNIRQFYVVRPSFKPAQW